MSNEKYYTPHISEFHVGFVYQSKNNAKEEFETYEVEHDFDSCVYQHLIDKEEVRVKLLDREDIEAEGWKYSRTIPPSYFAGYEEYTIVKYYILKRFTNTKMVGIYKTHAEDGNYQLFNGTIKNRSELRKVMEMAGITKQS